MRRAGNIFEKVVDLDNIKAAIVFASKDKRDRATVRACLSDIDGTARMVQRIMLEGFAPTKPRVRIIHDQNHGKDRLIACPSFFPDQIVHHALMQQLIPILEPRMYAHSYGSIANRGSHRAVHQVEKWMRRGNRMRYTLTMDVRKFYEHCKPDVVMAALEKRIKDRQVLDLCESIVNGYEPGLPLGYYTSQWFANLVLTDLDFKIKDAGAEQYARYMDDMLVMSKSKKRLHAIRRMVSDELSEMGMELKDNWQVFKIGSRDVYFLGYRISRVRTALRRKTFLRLRRRFSRAAKRAPTAHEAMALMSYYGVLQHADLKVFTSGLRPRKNDLRRVIRHESIQRQTA